MRSMDRLDLQLTQEIIDDFDRVIDQSGVLPGKGVRVGYYPSSGYFIGRVLALACDVFFFSDYGYSPGWINRENEYHQRLLRHLDRVHVKVITKNNHFLVGQRDGKTIFFCFIQNRLALKLIERAGYSIHAYVGVRDGCVEGGNDECVNNYPFLEKVIRLAADEGMQAFVDHSEFLRIYSQYVFGDKIIGCQGVSQEVFTKSPMGPTLEYKVKRHEPVRYSWEEKGIRLTVEHDSVLNHVNELDGLVCSPMCYRIAKEVYGYRGQKFVTMQPKFFKPSLDDVWDSGKSLIKAIELAEKKGWEKIGITAFGEGKHEDFLDILKARGSRHPLWIRLFHLEENDFSGLKEKMELVTQEHCG